MKNRWVFFSLFFSVGVFFSVACSKNEAPEGEAIPLSGAAAGDLSDQALGVDYTAPEGWVREAPKSAMRAAQYRLPSPDGDAEVAVYTGIGGSPEQNIDRWIGQFSLPQGGSAESVATTSKRQVNGLPVSTVDVSGTYSSGMPMGGAGVPLENYRLLGAVIETNSGLWFVKLTGPAGTVEKWEPSFEQFIDSFKAK